MDQRTLLQGPGCLVVIVIAIAVTVSGLATSSAEAQSDVPGIYSEEVNAGGNVNMTYLVHSFGRRPRPPKDGFGVVVVLPGGDGSEEFAPFVRGILKRTSLFDRFMLWGDDIMGYGKRIKADKFWNKK